MKKAKTNFWTKVYPWILPVAIIVFWQIAVQTKLINSQYVPAPSAIVDQAIKSWQAGTLQKNISISLYRATLGFIWGGGLGFFFGLFSGISALFRATFDSTIQMLRNIPHMALIPLIILVLGIDESAKIFLVAVGTFFPIYINTYHGISSVSEDLLEMGRSYDLTNWQLFTKIIFPGALPTILMGVRYSLGTMWVSLIVAETVSADSGIGYMSTNAQQFMNVKIIYLCIIIYALLGKLSDFMAKQLEIISLDWQKA
ncbi:ABC transporter permease subunit [Ligilactobacillus apodemi]|uniref:ABC transporter permease subunit n=1 Tax=Ligilactobacillus apodemi TaxID=307126 RepID=UPI00214C18AB|nr:ABC transporter permease subunit [Ligilactobacillus apodemi]MCR1901745.1 ABC transporter permease subunit [Ligilactobacillus apodemi]